MQLRNHLWIRRISPFLFVIVLGCTIGDTSRMSGTNGHPSDVCYTGDSLPAKNTPLTISAASNVDACHAEVFTGTITRCTLWPDIDLSLYEVLPSLEDKTLNWETVQPAEATDYWELRRGSGGVIVKAGDKCKTATNREACIVAFDALNSAIGFSAPSYFPTLPGPPPFVVSNHGDRNCVWDTKDKLKVFLGDINSKEEAILWLWYTSSGFFGAREDKEKGAIREVDGEYELIVLKNVSMCEPVQTNRYLIRIQPSGKFVVLREQIYEQETNTCIIA